MRLQEVACLILACAGVDAFMAPTTHRSAPRRTAAALPGKRTVTTPCMMVASLGTIADECVGDRSVESVSYAEQFDTLFSKPLKTSTPISKPSNQAQQKQSNAKRVPFSNVFGTLMRLPTQRAWTSTDIGRATWFTIGHVLGILAWTRYFSWERLGGHFLLYCASGMGITFSYHRQLAHRSFKSSKLLEYTAACERYLAQARQRDGWSKHPSPRLLVL